MALFSVTAASASSVFDANYVAANVIDMVVSADPGKRWASNTTTMPQWLQLDLGTPQTANYYAVAPGMYSTAQDPAAWAFQGSNDASSWTTLDTRSSQSFSGSPRRYDIANGTAYRYYRLNITATGGDVASIGEFAVGSAELTPTAAAQILTGNIDNASSGTVTLTATPTAQQTVLVSVQGDRSDITVSGLGATWTQICNSMATSFGSAVNSVWVGRAATAAGAITISAGGAFTAQVLAMLLTNNDGTNIRAMGNGASAAAFSGQLVITSILESGGGTPVIGGSTVPATGWTQTTMFTASNSNKFRHAYIFATTATYGAQWTGLNSAASNALIVGFPTTTYTRVESLYLEEAVTTTPLIQVENVYMEGMLAMPSSPIRVEAAYTEIMVISAVIQRYVGWGIQR